MTLPRLQPTATDCPTCHRYLARTDDGAHCDVCEVGWDDDGVPAAYEDSLIPLPTQPCGCPVGQGHRCPPKF